MSTPVGPSSLRRSGDAELLHFGEQRRASEAEARRRTACEVPSSAASGVVGCSRPTTVRPHD